jgi:hypothetical protein
MAKAEAARQKEIDAQTANQNAINYREYLAGRPEASAELGYKSKDLAYKQALLNYYRGK